MKEDMHEISTNEIHERLTEDEREILYVAMKTDHLTDMEIWEAVAEGKLTAVEGAEVLMARANQDPHRELKVSIVATLMTLGVAVALVLAAHFLALLFNA